MKTTSILLFGVALSAIGAHAVAQNFPAKLVRIVVPFPPGGTSDATARLIAQRLTERWKQNVVVDNRGGAGGNIAAEHVARSPADGYTLLMGTHGTQAINVSLFAKLPYDPVRDFTPVTLAITVPNLFLAHPSLPVRSMKDLVALAKARPGEINFASAGYGTMPHMAGELFNLMAGVKMTPILYKGSGPAMSEVLGGLVPLMIESLLTSLPHVKSGKLRALAITSAQRNPAVPDISTVAETGFAGYEGITWVGLVVPAATPRDIVSLLNTEIATILQAPEMRKRLTAMGAAPGGGSPEQFAGYIRSETEKWAKVVKAAGLKAE
jgi:tripartite-type tricarboxylate transporter receptor subunit TctC